MKTNANFFVKAGRTLAFLTFIGLFVACNDSDDPAPTDDEIIDTEVTYTATQLASGAALKGANGIDIGSDGNLYIASVIGLEIAVMNKENGSILERFGPDMGVNGPDDLVFGPDGSLYWTNILLGTVGRMEPDGTLSEQFVAPGVNPIGFSDDGRLFVALDFLGDGLYELDPNLTNAPRPIIIATEANPFPLGFLNAFDFGADGRLYGPLFAAGLVISVDVDRTGAPDSDPFADGSAIVVSGGYRNPASAKFDSDGLLTVLDQTGEVFKVDTMTGEKTLFATLDPGLDNMVFATDGTLYMTNNDSGWVAEISATGQPSFISPGGLIAPQGIAVLAGANNQDALFIGDQYNIRQFNGSTGNQDNRFQGFLIPAAEGLSLITPQNVSADGNNLLICSWFAGEVQLFSPQTGEVLEQYPMVAPIEVIRFKEDIAVVDVGLGGVVWASDQSMILAIDNTTVFAPSGLATDGDTLYVADWGTGSILAISFEGSTPNTPVAVATGLVNPEGLALDADGTLLVAETGAGRVSRVDPATGEVTTVVENISFSAPGLEIFPPTWGFDDVAVGPTGVIYVSGGGTNVIYRVTKD